jgi:8-oxo-dGTP pyrophosphatase MutT (NUDIX family)
MEHSERRVATVILVDRRGWLLLQKRDAAAPIAPNQWGMVGGQVEAGETAETAAYRELLEETGLVPTHELRSWREEVWSYPDGPSIDYSIWCGPADASDDDIQLGEGEAIVFVDPKDVLTLDLTGSAAYFLPKFLDSDLYRDVIRDASSM